MSILFKVEVQANVSLTQAEQYGTILTSRVTISIGCVFVAHTVYVDCMLLFVRRKTMSPLSRYRWPGVATIALTFSLIFVFASSLVVSANETLIRISSDPYKNPDSLHKTEVEPDSFAFGNTVVSAFQVGRFFNGGSSNIGWATSTDGGNSWTHGFLPFTTVNANPPGTYARASDASVAYDAKHKVWLISYLGLRPPAPSAPVDVLVSRSTDGGL